MRFVPDMWQDYDHIQEGQRFKSLEDARAAAETDFYGWFPANVPEGLITVHDTEPGSGFLAVHYETAVGGFCAEIEFKDFRPIKRMGSENAKAEMFR